jgi:hypothetical protein
LEKNGFIMRVYFAAKTRHLPFIEAFRPLLAAASIDLHASWLSWPWNTNGREPSPEVWKEHVHICLSEVSEAEITIFYVADGEQHLGALIEASACLCAGKQLYLVSPHPWPFIRHHKNCYSFTTLEKAFEAVLA